MVIKNNIANLVLATALGIGCGEEIDIQPQHESDYVHGTVINETGTLQQVITSCTDLSNYLRSPVPLDYILQIETDKGIYTATIIPNFNPSNKTLEALATAVKLGSKVKLGKSLFDENTQYPRFSTDNIGTL